MKPPNPTPPLPKGSNDPIYQLVRLASHDIKNMIGVSLMTCDTLTRSIAPDATQRQLIDDVKKGLREVSDRLSALVDAANAASTNAVMPEAGPHAGGEA